MDTKLLSSLEIRECDYKCEHYSAREDGMIMRHHREGMRKRKLDDVWRYGTLNYATGYMEFCGERVHRIVATAFHGQAPSEQYVVDHIDTNRQNNRPNNLRWLTKLENILNNEITRKKVEMICGSIEAFLENPSLLYGYESEDKNFIWMRNVSKEEAKNCLDNWSNWAKTAVPNPNYKKEEHHIGNWIFDKPVNRNQNPSVNYNAKPVVNLETEEKKIDTVSQETSESEVIDTNEWLEKTYGKEEPKKEEDYWTDSLTPLATQSWNTPTKFPCCPATITNDSLNIYKENMKTGDVFSSNFYNTYYVIDKAIIPNKSILIVLCTNNDGDNMFGAFALCGVKLEKGKLAHWTIRRYGNKEIATRFFNLIIGKEKWTEEDEILWDT